MELQNEKSFAENLSETENTAFSVFRHQRYNYRDVLTDIREQFGFQEKLYDVVLSYQNANIGDTGYETTWYHCGMQTEHLQIHIEDRDNEGKFRIHYDYLCDCFSEKEIGLLHRHLMNLLFSAIEDDSKKLYEPEMLTEEEKQKLLIDFNDTAVDYPREKSVSQLFEEQVKENPGKVAIIDKNRTLTYKALSQQVDRYCATLQLFGVRKGAVVAIHLDRSYEITVFQLAVIKAGAVFLPVDKRYPLQRIKYMCDDCNVFMMISDSLQGIKTVNVISLEKFKLSITSCPTKTIYNDICYIIYTSGSTGQPKGCALSNIGIVNFCINNNTIEILNRSSCNIFACVNSVSFDYYIAESLLPLLNGYSMAVFDEIESTNQEHFLTAMEKFGVNVLMTTPTRLKLFFEDGCNCRQLSQLDCICSSGESLPPDLLRVLYSKSPKAQVFNPLGPSECSVWVVGGELKKENDIHIGKPIANTQVYITDQYGNLLPVGAVGELCIAGDGVGAGYLNRPGLTAEKFVDNPFGTGKLYKTGDLAYWREDGNIGYVGRNDFQVKIRGLRIELGEIENAVSSIDGVMQAVVVVRKNKEDRQLLCAFYTGEELGAKEIRARLSKSLPKYMLPHIVTHLEKMPMTPSGKINRKALPEVDLYHISSDKRYVAPSTEEEKAVCRIMETVLRTSPIGAEDDFFENGGDSLKAIHLVSEAQREGFVIPLQAIFDNPSPRLLCQWMNENDRPSVSYAEEDFSAIERLLSGNTAEKLSVPPQTDLEDVLITGATGFLGVHILAEYLNTHTGTAYCLVRGKSAEDSRRRLSEYLSFYFGSRFTDCARIRVFCGDLGKARFGLPEEAYGELTQRVKTVINCAASVKHYGSYQYFYDANVLTVRQLIAFCQTADARLIHTSTLSVSGNSFVDRFDGTVSGRELTFAETDFYIGQPLGNVYARSKFEAEKAVLEAAANGLHANIMRMGNLTNRKDGQFQKNYESNAFVKRLRAIVELGVIPDYLSDIYLEFTPIEEAAAAVMRIAEHFSDEKNVFHINSTKVVYLDRFLELLSQIGVRVGKISHEKFAEILRQTVRSEETKYIFETFVNDMDSDNDNKLAYESGIHIENAFTETYLRALGFEWSEIGTEYLRRYFDYFRKIGYFGEEK